MDINPRLLREKLARFVGKKVTIGTTDWHYISGTVESSDGISVAMRVAGSAVTVPAEMVATIREAPAAQAEYVK